MANFCTKSNWRALVFLGFLALTFAVPGNHYHDYKPVISYYTPPNYEYSYGVHDEHTGDVKTAQETRVGSITKGSYSVLQPDGILRTVTYVADPWNGFQAVVSNKGYSHHPTHITHAVLPVVPVIPKAIVLKTPARPLAHPYRRPHPRPATTTMPPSPPPSDHHDYTSYETHSVTYE